MPTKNDALPVQVFYREETDKQGRSTSHFSVTATSYVQVALEVEFEWHYGRKDGVATAYDKKGSASVTLAPGQTQVLLSNMYVGDSIAITFQKFLVKQNGKVIEDMEIIPLTVGDQKPVAHTTGPFDAGDIRIDLVDRGFADDITQDKVLAKKYFDETVFNGSSQAIRWITVEVAIVFFSQTTESTVASYVSEGSTRYVRGNFDVHTTWGYRHTDKFEAVAPGQLATHRGNWTSFGREISLETLQSQFKEMVVCQYFGELADGSKFRKVLHPEIRFDHNGYFHGRTRKEKNCFVTTAAYGDPDHPMVEEFRELRDRILIHFSLGQRFIRWYYRRGPALAAVVRSNPIFPPLARFFLTPLALSSRAVLSIIDQSACLRKHFHP